MTTQAVRITDRTIAGILLEQNRGLIDRSIFTGCDVGSMEGKLSEWARSSIRDQAGKDQPPFGPEIECCQIT